MATRLWLISRVLNKLIQTIFANVFIAFKGENFQNSFLHQIIGITHKPVLRVHVLKIPSGLLRISH